MSFGNLSALGSLLGLAGLAGLFFLLQRLRVRHRPVVVETSLFWRQAVEESRARVFVERFRHPWAYLLLFAIAALLWLAFAGPRRTAVGDRDHLVLLDGSAGMAWEGRWEEALADTLEYAGGLPPESRRVVLCAGRPETVLRPGEELPLLAERLAGRLPEAAPATVARTLASLSRAQRTRPLEVCVVGDAPLEAAELALLPEDVSVRRLASSSARQGENSGITTLGVSAAASGRWDAVDILVEVAISGAAKPGLPALTIDGAVVPELPKRADGPSGVRLTYADVPARGGLLEVRLPGGDALGLDDRAQFVLPDRRRIGVAVEPALPAVVRQALAADPGLALDAVQPSVSVRRGGSDFGGGLPALEFVGAEQSEDAFLVRSPIGTEGPAGFDPDGVLLELYTGLGLDEIDAMGLARESGRRISFGVLPVEAGEPRGLMVWQELLDEQYDFAHGRSFPLFLGLSLRWLAGFDPGPARVAVAEPLAYDGRSVTGPSGRVSLSLAHAFVPAEAGVYGTLSSDRFAASLLSPFATRGVAGGTVAADLAAAEVRVVSPFDPVTLLLLCALLLLGAEWILYRTGRIP